MSDRPALSLNETMDRVVDGSEVIDASACALALFVTMTGETHIKSPYTALQVAGMLRQLADRLDP